MPLRSALLTAVVIAALSLAAVSPAPAQPSETRAALIAAAQAAKAREARPHDPGLVESLVTKADEFLVSGIVRWHPFFGTPYQGAGLTLGAGYLWHLGDVETLDVRASASISRSSRVEAEFRAPRLFDRRGVLTVTAGRRDGRGVPFYGLGAASTAPRSRFDLLQTFGDVALDVRPNRRGLRLQGSVGYVKVEPSAPDDVGRQTLPGLGARTSYLQSRGAVVYDWRPAEGYARRGGAYGVTLSRFDDLSGPYSFRQIDYDVVQHLPLLRDAWVLSAHARVETTSNGDGETVPFFMMPTLGSGTTLRGFASGRFRDRHSVLLSGEWRILLNSVIDAALFYDAGKVTARRADIDLHGLATSYGAGLRFHSVAATALRLDLARSRDGLVLVVGATAAF